MINRLNQLTSKQILWMILLVAFVLRLATALWLGDTMTVLPAGGTHDQVSYDMLAKRVAEGHGFTFPQYWYPWVQPDTPTSYYSGTMVLHLAGIYVIFGYHPLIARILYAILGTVICYLVYTIGKRLFNEKVGLVSAGIAACYAYLILYSATLLTETPFILFLLLALNASFAIQEKSTTKKWVLLGMALAGTILFRMAIAPFIALLLAWTFWFSQPRRLWQPLVAGLIMVSAIAPWTIRNYLLFDRFMLLESQFGHVFWNSNHPDQGYTFDQVDWVAPIPEELKDLNEVDLTYALLDRGIENVKQDPARYISLTLSRFRIFFMFWPSADSGLMSNVGRVFSFGVMLPFMIYGLYLSRSYWRKTALLYLFLFIHLGIYLASWVMIRYRVPADTVLIIFAGLALVHIAKKLPWPVIQNKLSPSSP